MRDQSSKKPAPAVTGNRLQKADRLGGSISSQNSKSRAPRQIPTRSCSQMSGARRRPSRYPIANIDCGFDERAFYVRLFQPTRLFGLGAIFEPAGRHPATEAPSAKIWPRCGMGATMRLSAKIVRRWRRSKERQIRKQFNAYRLLRAQHCARGGK
jgi:hypothetical protein